MTDNTAGPVQGHLVQAGSITGDVYLGALPTPIPRQLPPAPATFVGREPELAALTDSLGDKGTVVITALAGTGGIGKTALALQWAHQHQDDFPDGQLFVDLRGFSPDSTPISPAVAVRGFLDALGVDPAHQPADPYAHYRSLVANKRMLIILDNAADTTQVLPLLPGSPTCTVLVTSRNHLPGLVGTHGARHVPLDILDRPEAKALLTDRLGTADPDAIEELVSLCGGFPLALNIVAGRARTQPHLPLSEVVAELYETGLDEDDPTASVTAVLSWSYKALTEEQARVLGLLGVAPGPDISLPAAVSLTGLPHTRRVLRSLEQLSLVHRRADRWWMHDLVRKFAAAQARDHDQPLRRLIDFYLHSALAANHHLERLHTLPIPTGSPPTTLPDIPDRPAALAWFDAEHTCLHAAIPLAASQGEDKVVVQLAWASTTYRQRRGHRLADHDAWRLGLAAAERLDHPAARGTAYRLFGRACLRIGREEEGRAALNAALELAIAVGDIAGQAHAHRGLTLACDGIDALAASARALEAFRRLGVPEWEAKALNDYGRQLFQQDRLKEAEQHCAKALRLARQHDFPDGAMNALHSLGFFCAQQHRHLDALRHQREALVLCRELGDTQEEGLILLQLGRALLSLGRFDEAVAAINRAQRLISHQG